MDLDLSRYYESGKYKSPSQIARVITERWVKDNLYCPVCGRSLLQYRAGMPVYDFYCEHLDERIIVLTKNFVSDAENFQLKSQKNHLSRYVLGAAYSMTVSSLKAGTYPSLILLCYNANNIVTDVELIHKLAITISCIKPRKPLSKNARRSGWQGYNIDLHEIPNIGRIEIIKSREIKQKTCVMAEWKNVSKILLGNLSERGWTADVIKCLEKLPTTFTSKDAYKFEERLRELHPQNKHIRDKIRQQLQILRDRNFIKFESPGVYVKSEKS